MQEKEIVELLKQRNISITQNRIKIMQCLTHDGAHFHSINDLIAHMGKLNVKSLYNNIKVLSEAGIVDSYSFNGVSKYAVNDNLYSEEEIHIISSSNKVNHIKVNPIVFEEIKKSVSKDHKKLKGIKIFVEVE